jgi:hypothetical protein
VTNPNDPNEQRNDLLQALRQPSSPQNAAAVVLNAIYARQQAISLRWGSAQSWVKRISVLVVCRYLVAEA